MAFRTNTSEAQENSAIKPEGDYEVVISGWRRKTTPNGKESIGFSYVIRNDIEQPYKNGVMFSDIWKKKEPDTLDEMAEGYNYRQLMAIAKAANIPNDADYETFEDFLNELVGKPVKVHLRHRTYEGKEYEDIDKHSATIYTDVKHVPKDKPQSDSYAPPKKTAPKKTKTTPAPVPEAKNTNDDYPF